MESEKVKVLFVCMGNICRSPTAEGVFLKHVQDAGMSHLIEVDSAGTHAYHIGESPDARATQVAATRGYDLTPFRARRASSDDFKQFHYVLAMDKDNYANLESICPEGFEERLNLFMQYASVADVNEVPDPYYGGKKGFEYVLDLVENASQGLLNHILRNHQR